MVLITRSMFCSSQMLERGLIELVRREQRFLPGESSQSQVPRCSSFHLPPVEDPSYNHPLLRNWSSAAAACEQRVCRWHASDFVLGVKVVFVLKYLCGPERLVFRTLYISRQCTSSDGDNAAPCLLRGLAVLDWLLLLPAGPCLLRRPSCPDSAVLCQFLMRLCSPDHAGPVPPMGLAIHDLFLGCYYSLVITSGPKVAFVTPAIPVDRSGQEGVILISPVVVSLIMLCFGIKANTRQPKLYDAKLLNDENVKLNLYDTEETLEETEESRLKMKERLVQINYAKLDKLYETFVSETELYLKLRYFSDASTSNVTLEIEIPQKSSSPPKEMPKLSRMLDIFGNLGDEIKRLVKLIEEKLVITRGIHFAYNNDGDIRTIFHEEVKPISQTICLWITMLKEEFTKEVQKLLIFFESMESDVDETSKKHETLQNEFDQLFEATLATNVRNCVVYYVEQIENNKLRDENERISNDSKDVQANLLKRIVILEKDFKRCQDQSIVESLTKERENVKLEYQKLFNSIKTTRAQHLREVNELIENVNQKTYAYEDVQSQNQDLLMTMSELKAKLKSVEKGKNVDNKFDKSLVIGKVVYVTPLNKDKDQKSKFVPKIDVKQDLSKPITSYSSPKFETGRVLNSL
ncbi:hypothetical protein Tco_1384985 [Tanacetum coccineum]